MSTADGGGPSNGGGTEDRSNAIWNRLLPSFDPMVDDPQEYKDKVTFLHQICPAKDKAMLAPRFSMMCKGTAWSQEEMLDPVGLTDPEGGMKALLAALATWEAARRNRTRQQCCM